MDAEQIQHVAAEENGNFDRSWREEKWGDCTLSVAARETADNERLMSTMEAVKSHKKAILWSLTISTCVIMEGFDTSLLYSFYAYPAFQRKFGDPVPITPQTPTGFSLSAAWQSGLGLGGALGSVVGTIINGWLVPAFGPRKVILSTLCALTCLLFIVFFAPDKPVLLVGEILLGVPWGIFATTALAYASEVLPLQLRIYLTSYTNMCFIIGNLISGGVLRGLVHRQDQWGYRIPFAVQWVWPCILIPLIYSAPESPWHLVRHNRLQEAERSIQRLQGPGRSGGLDVQRQLAQIVGFERRRTEIAMVAFAGQLLCGFPFGYASTYFFQQIELNPDIIYSLNVGAEGLSLFACFCNWFLLIPRFGRRTIYLVGMSAMAVELCLVGILNVWADRRSISWAQAILTLVWTFTFQATVGQLGWALPAEVGSTRLRQKTVCLARNVVNVCFIVGGTLENYMMNPTAWNLRGYTGFVWTGSAIVVLIWAYFRLPETKGRSFYELDILFAKQIPARQFATTEVDAFDEHDNNQLAVRYSAGPSRPSLVPSITDRLAEHGRAEPALAQRRASIVTGDHTQRRPSIGPAVTEYLKHH